MNWRGGNKKYEETEKRIAKDNHWASIGLEPKTEGKGEVRAKERGKEKKGITERAIEVGIREKQWANSLIPISDRVHRFTYLR